MRGVFAYETAISIDETSRRRGLRYVSVVADEKKRRVFFATEWKGQNVIERLVADFLNKFGDDPEATAVVSANAHTQNFQRLWDRAVIEDLHSNCPLC